MDRLSQLIARLPFRTISKLYQHIAALGCHPEVLQSGHDRDLHQCRPVNDDESKSVMLLRWQVYEEMRIETLGNVTANGTGVVAVEELPTLIWPVARLVSQHA